MHHLDKGTIENIRRRLQQKQSGEYIPTGLKHAADRPESPWYKTTKGQITMLLMTVAVGSLIYYGLRPETSSESKVISNGNEKKKDLLKFGSSSHTLFKPCTMHHAIQQTQKRSQNSSQGKDLAELELRRIVESKITLDNSFLETYQEILQVNQFDGELIRNLIIDYYINHCGESLVYLLNTPLRIELTGVIDVNEPTIMGMYYGKLNIIKLCVPVWKTIVSSVNSAYPYDGYLRSLWHEQWHSIIAARNSVQDCDPLVIMRRIINNSLSVGFVPAFPRNPEILNGLIKKGDERIENELGQLLHKLKKVRGFNFLSKPEQAKYNRLQEKFKNYVPKRAKHIFIGANIEDPVAKAAIEKIRNGFPQILHRPNSDFPIYIDELHYEYQFDTGKTEIFGTGNYVENSNDKLNAIVTDTRVRIEQVKKVYAVDAEKSLASFPKLMSEIDALVYEMGPEVLKAYYPELLTEHAKLAEQSLCQPAENTIHYKG